MTEEYELSSYDRHELNFDQTALGVYHLLLLKIVNRLNGTFSKIYDTCIGCTQCVRACPTDVLEMIPWDGCKANQIASAPRTEDCVGCKRCESACPTDF
ncbi:hypothetical protein L7F22_045760 [Adiantum nelumboides]|nr:hypothetical protein [Adiantum nelumboides]